MNITTTPKEILLKDLKDSRKDIATCKAALEFGITTYSGGSVLERMNGNRRIVKIILAELARRDKPVVEAEDERESFDPEDYDEWNRNDE